MNTETSFNENSTAKNKFIKMLGYALCLLIGFVIVLGVKSCIKDVNMPEEFKKAEKLLKREGFSCRYLDEKDEIKDLFDELDFDANGATEVLIAFDESSEDLFLIVYCDDVLAAQELESEFAWEIAGDDYLYYRGYTTKANYKTVYFGHKDLIESLWS